MKILIIGANGQLGSDLVKVLDRENLIPLTHRQIEICEPGNLKAAFEKYRPEVVLNMAAYHKVDECEKNAEKTFAVNAFGVRNLALACREYDITLLHVSTDYVFGGEKKEPYVEEDAPRPLNVYGISKLAGEYFIRYTLERYFIVRSSGLYGVARSSGKGGNFVEWMLQLASQSRELRVVNDQVLTPTYTVDLAGQIRTLIDTEDYGLYHITNHGACSWYEFALKIFELAGVGANIRPTTSAEYGAPALRPAYSVLRNKALQELGIDDMRPWEEALKDYLREREENALKTQRVSSVFGRVP